MKYQRDYDGFDRVATLDIETTHYDPQQGKVVSIGIGVHNCGEPASEATYIPYHRGGPDDEPQMIESALRELDELEADVLVTYNGADFDLDFLSDRLYLEQHTNVIQEIGLLDTHIDLMADRKQMCDRTGKKWPKLEDCLTSYGFPEPETVWNGRPLTNVRFGEELGPLYLESLLRQDSETINELVELINHYLFTDLEANLAIYYADVGVGFEPSLLDDRQEFTVVS